jgi:hypothetical protein
MHSQAAARAGPAACGLVVCGEEGGTAAAFRLTARHSQPFEEASQQQLAPQIQRPRIASGRQGALAVETVHACRHRLVSPDSLTEPATSSLPALPALPAGTTAASSYPSSTSAMLGATCCQVGTSITLRALCRCCAVPSCTASRSRSAASLWPGMTCSWLMAQLQRPRQNKFASIRRKASTTT